MLATETKAIASLLREAIIERYGEDTVQEHFADTSDTLCYATYENQEATSALIDDGADLALVVGGYNSSNTGHLVELCEEQMPTYFVRDEEEIDSPAAIRHFDVHSQSVVESEHWLPTNGTLENPTDIILTSGASCPDALLDEILVKLVSWFPEARSIDEVVAPFEEVVEQE